MEIERKLNELREKARNEERLQNELIEQLRKRVEWLEGLLKATCQECSNLNNSLECSECSLHISDNAKLKEMSEGK